MDGNGCSIQTHFLSYKPDLLLTEAMNRPEAPAQFGKNNAPGRRAGGVERGL